MSLQNQEWVSTQKWLLDIKTSTGQADLEKYNKILMESSEEAVTTLILLLVHFWGEQHGLRLCLE